MEKQKAFACLLTEGLFMGELMNHRVSIVLVAVVLLTSLTLAFPSWNEEDHTRWIVPLQTDAQVTGILRAATARGCEEHIRTERFISFNCPQGQRPTAGAQAATQYVLHDGTTNELIRAAEVHGGIPQGPFDGTGVRVAVIDSGVDTDHPAISDAVIVCSNTTGDANGCEDMEGHGTAVSAIIAGTGAVGSEGESPHGVAPGASIIAVKVFPDNGDPVYSDDVAAALLLALSLEPDIINLSLGGGKSTLPACDASGDPAVDVINMEAAAAGVAVVVSAGNDGSKDGIGFPACASSAIAVGAVYQRDEGRVQWVQSCTDSRTAPDQVTCFSNSGAALDVVAPGAFLWTAARGGGFSYFHGTSAAAPVVSGAAALLLEQEPSLTGKDLLQTLRDTALELGSKKDQARNGYGRIDSVLAAQYVADHYQPCTVDNDCDDGNPCNGTEHCEAGACTAGTPLACDDGDACNGAEVCNPSTGACLPGTPLECDDGNACTDDHCEPAVGCVSVGNGTCPACTPASKGRCNCDGVCSPREL